MNHPDSLGVVGPSTNPQHLVETARKFLKYDPDSGLMTWVSPRQRIAVGAEAGYLGPNGYRRVMIDGVPYLVHRLAWLLMTGKWPSDQIDHIDGTRDNNKWANLRDVISQHNSQNERRPRSNNQLGVLGVRALKRGRYEASIGVDGRKKYIGTFDTPEEAHAEYVEAKRRFHPGATL